jgi:hypothetical protein
MPFTLTYGGGGSNQYFLTANLKSGHAGIIPVWYYAAGKIVQVGNEVWNANWNKEYTVYMPFRLEQNGSSVQYFLNANTVSGRVSIREIYYDTNALVQVSQEFWWRSWNKEYTIYMPFTLKPGDTVKQYFLTGNPTSGNFAIRRIRYGDDGQIVVDEPAWTAKWEPASWICVPLSLDGVQYTLFVDTTHGKMQIRPVTENKDAINVGEPVWQVP